MCRASSVSMQALLESVGAGASAQIDEQAALTMLRPSAVVRQPNP